MFHINTLNASSRNKCKQYFQFMVLQVLSTLLQPLQPCRPLLPSCPWPSSQRRRLLVQFVVGCLVKEHKIVQFVPGFSLRPLLLFGFPTSSPFFLFRGLGRGFASSLRVLLGTHDGISCRSESSNI